MKNSITTLLVMGMFLTPAAFADDADDVKATLEKYFNVVNGGNARGWAQYFMPEASVFGNAGQLLSEASPQQRESGLQANLDAGTKYALRLGHLDVKVYGSAALITGYRLGTVTNPDGSVQRGPLRYSAMWVKQGGQWKQVHRHLSPLTLSQ